MAAASKIPTVKNIMGRALRETGAAMKESGRSEVWMQKVPPVLIARLLLHICKMPAANTKKEYLSWNA
jgi:hypothetical protein